MSDVINGGKILKYIDRINGNHAPITADIFLDNYCNNKCGYCTYRRWEFSNDAYSMSFDDFLRYAVRLRELGVQGFILTGGGEPTIAKDFGDITKWLEDIGIPYGINTNFNRFIEINPDYLKVSLDAWDENSYEAKRGVRAYRTVIENICEYAEYKTDATRLGIQLLAKSAEEVDRFYEANMNLPVDYIVIRPVESTGGEYYHKHQDTKSITDKIDVIKKDDDRVIKNFKWDMLGIQFDSCIGQWSQIALNEHGEVMYCCHKPYQTIGHIMDDDILEKKRLAHTDMSMCDVPCRLTSTNHILSQVYSEQVNKEFI